MEKREYWLDSLKGIAIIFVVLGHVLDGAMGKSLFPEAVWMHILYIAIYIFHMPLFFSLSGISFAKLKEKLVSGSGGGVLA